MLCLYMVGVERDIRVWSSEWAVKDEYVENVKQERGGGWQTPRIYGAFENFRAAQETKKEKEEKKYGVFKQTFMLNDLCNLFNKY